MISPKTNSPKKIQSYRRISLAIHHYLPFGQAIYVCGNIEELGNWCPSKALRLLWSEGDLWTGSILLPFSEDKTVEFKFMIADWCLSTCSTFAWQSGKNNRYIDLSMQHPHLLYKAKWDFIQITVCLMTGIKSQHHKATYNICGNTPLLGQWQQTHSLQPLSQTLKEEIRQYFTYHPYFTDQPNLDSLRSFTFSVPLQTNSVNYRYGMTTNVLVQQKFPGRILMLKGSKVSDCVTKFWWNGKLFAIDQFPFSKMPFFRLSNQIEMTINQENYPTYSSFKQRNITCIVNIVVRTNVHASLANYHLHKTCEDNGIMLEQRVFENTESHEFMKKIFDLILLIEGLAVKGNRVGILIDPSLMASIPIQALYLTQFLDYSFMEAIKVLRQKEDITNDTQQIAKDIIEIVSNKINRGRIVQPTN